MKTKRLILLAGAFMVLTGCAMQKYYWGDYEKSLYKYYKNPGDLDDLAENLADTIEHGEEKNKVPPGIYAEYGYVLLIQGKAKEAILYFDKEKEHWPESTHLMNIMLRTANSKQQNKPEVKTNDSGVGVNRE